MSEPEVTKTRKSYHDIGICVVVVEDKVTDLLRKIVANELSKKDQAGWLALLPTIREGHSENYQSYKVLRYLVAESKNSQQLPSETKKVQQLPSETQQVQQLPSETQNEFFKEFENMNDRFQMTFEGSGNEILDYLKDNPQAYRNLIKVLIEKFTRDIQAKATDLNNFLGKEMGNKWRPLGKNCFDKGDGAQMPKQHDDCQKWGYCKYRYQMNGERKGQWDWVNGMNFIRNCVVHRSFKFKDQAQEGEFREKYGKFIKGVPFQDLSPLKEKAVKMEEEYEECMRVHDVVKGEVGRRKDDVERLSEENRKPEDECHSTMGEISVKDRIDWWKGQDERSSKEHSKPVDERRSTMGGSSDWMDKNKGLEADGYSEDHDDKYSDKASHVEELYHMKRDKTKIKNWNRDDT